MRTDKPFDPFAMCLHWERELDNAIQRRYRIPRGRHNPERRMYRKWLRHCRRCAEDWAKLDAIQA